MCNNRECADYLKKNAAYNRFMKELWKKWKRYGRAAGSITFHNATEAERRAIGGIVGKTFMGETITVTFQDFEQGLQKTRFAPIDMRTVLEIYFAGPLYTNQEQKAQEQRTKDEFWSRLLSCFDGGEEDRSAAFRWIGELYRQKKYGYQILTKEFNKNPEEAEVLAKNVGMALNRIDEMDGEEILLAVFAAAVSGNPHYFDRGAVAGQLLTHAVCFREKIDVPQSAYEWRACMQSVGIVADNIASMIHVFGVRLETVKGPHPAYEAFYHRKEPYVLTAENLKSITNARAVHNKVYVVENEMVFMHLVENAKDQEAAILCTSGQLRVAALQLLDRLTGSGAVIYYSGDLDPAGMDIADRLWQRYGNAVRLWRMGPGDYRGSISGELLSDRQLARLKRLKNATLCRTAELVQKEKVAGYQENLLQQLLADVLQGYETV